MRHLAILMLAGTLSACASVDKLVGRDPSRDEAQACPTSGARTLYATLWMQTSSEYVANSLLVYQRATATLEGALKDKNSTAALEQTGKFQKKPPAIIMDLDETVLDNSPFQASLVGEPALPSNEFGPRWADWVGRRAAGGVPGAVAFINTANAKGVKVIFISNRLCRSAQACQAEATADNLRKLGVKAPLSKETMFLQTTDSGEKKARREEVAKAYRVIMLFGDDLGDFMAGVKDAGMTPETRLALTTQHAKMWGTRWFMLANPAYGSWANILADPKCRYLRTVGSATSQADASQPVR